MVRHKRFTAFLILLLLLSTFAAVVHHHDNVAADHDCPICLVNHRQQATSQSMVVFDAAPFLTETTIVSPSSDLIEQIAVSLLKNRAPPA